MSYGGRRGGRGGGGGRRHGNEEEQSRKLFIGGLSFDTDDEILREYFGQFGTITDSVVIRDKETDKSKGFGFVTFETEPEADDCMSKRPHTLQNRQVDVKRAVSREESSRPGAHVSVKKIFLGGLKEGMQEEDIRAFFETHGAIESIEIMREKPSGKIRGFGFVTFSDYDAVDKLVAKKHVEIAGVQCEVKKALSRAEMDKAKADAEHRAQKSSGYDSYGGGAGYRGYDNYGGGRYGGGGAYGDGGYGDRDGYGGGYGNGYRGGYSDGYGRSGYGGGGGYGSGGYGQDGYGVGGYGSGYGSGASSYGPMKGGQYSQRSGGPYGSGYGAGGCGGYGQGGGGYGGGGQGGYGGGSGGYQGGNYGGGRY